MPRVAPSHSCSFQDPQVNKDVLAAMDAEERRDAERAMLLGREAAKAAKLGKNVSGPVRQELMMVPELTRPLGSSGRSFMGDALHCR